MLLILLGILGGVFTFCGVGIASAKLDKVVPRHGQKTRFIKI